MQTGAKMGMRTMNQSLYELVRASVVNLEEAMQSSGDPEDLRRMFARSGKGL